MKKTTTETDGSQLSTQPAVQSATQILNIIMERKVIDSIEDYMLKRGIKARTKAVRELLSMGLMALGLEQIAPESVAPPILAIKPTARHPGPLAPLTDNPASLQELKAHERVVTYRGQYITPTLIGVARGGAERWLIGDESTGTAVDTLIDAIKLIDAVESMTARHRKDGESTGAGK